MTVGKERPILMTPENAHKIHVGAKTETRRLLRLPPWANDSDLLKLAAERPATGLAYFVDGIPTKTLICPYGLVGDRLWIRETWGCKSADRPGIQEGRKPQVGDEVQYAGDPADAYQWRNRGDLPWRPSIHMPRWACRTVVELTDIRVERLHDITEAGAQAEGVASRAEFAELWETIHGTWAWEANPWAWVLTFRKIEERSERP